MKNQLKLYARGEFHRQPTVVLNIHDLAVNDISSINMSIKEAEELISELKESVDKLKIGGAW